METNGLSSTPIKQDLNVYCIQGITPGMMTSNTLMIFGDFSKLEVGGRTLSNMKPTNSLRGGVSLTLLIGRSMELQTCCFTGPTNNEPNKVR